MLIKPLFKRADPRQEKIYILREIPNNLLSCERLPNLICATKTRPQAKRYHPWCVSDTSSGLFREQFAASSRKHDIYPSSAIRDSRRVDVFARPSLADLHRCCCCCSCCLTKLNREHIAERKLNKTAKPEKRKQLLLGNAEKQLHNWLWRGICLSMITGEPLRGRLN